MQRAGIGRYTRGLLAGLAELDTHHTYALLSAQRHANPEYGAEVFALPFHHKQLYPLPVSDVTLTRLWHRLQVPLPPQMVTGPLNVFLALDFALPPALLATPGVVMIYDLAYLTEPESADAGLRAYLTSVVPRSLRHATRVATISDHARSEIVRHYDIDPAKITVAPPGIGPVFRPLPDKNTARAICARLGVPDPFVLAVGTIQPRKNLSRLVDAYSTLRSEFPDLSLVLAGGRGWLDSPLFAHIETLGLREVVRFVESPTDDELVALYNSAELLAFPSLFEGFGIPVGEAMACGTPVICSNTSSLPQVAGDVAIMVDPRDTAALAEAMRRVLSNPELKHELARRGPAQAARFNWATTAQTVLTCLEEAARSQHQQSQHQRSKRH